MNARTITRVATLLSLVCLFLAVTQRSSAAEQPTGDAWPAYVIEWAKDVNSPADVSFLLDAPAGKDGFVTVKDGHFTSPAGKRLRFWGLNATMQGALPARESAPIIAANLARIGVNCIRFHFLDLPAPTGLLDGKADDTQHLDPQQLDRMDFFIAELKKRGIYADLNLHVGRKYKADDGVRDAELLGMTKSVTYFDPRIIELQKQYATTLLTHVNPYTGKAYREEPAVALVEFVNENSLTESWVQGRLLGKLAAPTNETWHDIPPSYGQALTEQYNQWLGKHVPADTLAKWRADLTLPAGEAIPRLVPKEFAKAPVDRFRAEAQFYVELEDAFFQGMAKHLRDTVGVKCPLIGNSDHGHGNACYALLASVSKLDVVDGHVYWQHPKYVTDAAGKRGFEINDTAMANDPLHSTPVQLSRSAVAGKPYTVSEVNHPFPAENACEGVPVLAAYAAFQDWDGIFWYTLDHKDVAQMEARVAGHFDFAFDPIKMTQLPAGALMFLRGDAKPAAQTITRTYSHEQVLDSLRLTWSQSPYFTPGFPLALPLMHAMRVGSFAGPATASFEQVPTDTVVSDTGELSWLNRKSAGVVAINTPRSQSLVGSVKPSDKTTNLSADLTTAFCAITLTSLDDHPIATSRKLLLNTAARAANTGMKWNEKRTTLENWGTAPTRIEPITGKIILSGIEATELTVQPLDGAGRPLGKASKLARGAGGTFTMTLSEATVWYMIDAVGGR